MVYDLKFTTPCWSATSSLLHNKPILGEGGGGGGRAPLPPPQYANGGGGRLHGHPQKFLQGLGKPKKDIPHTDKKGPHIEKKPQKEKNVIHGRGYVYNFHYQGFEKLFRILGLFRGGLRFFLGGLRFFPEG